MEFPRCEDDGLEGVSDALLKEAGFDPDCPTYTETQMARRWLDHFAASADTLEEMLSAPQPPQTFLDELRFLMAVTPLSRSQRLCLCGWLQGWTQAELRTRWREVAPPKQQYISRMLRRALCLCYEARGLSFAQFSRHSVYRRPARRQEKWRTLICRACGEPYVAGLGAGCFCSTHCREAAQRTRKGRGNRASLPETWERGRG